jgi:DNA processing protein
VAALRPFDLALLGTVRSRVVELAGELPPRPRLAIVGARAMLHGLGPVVHQAVAAAADAGWSVVSGGAMGVDAVAHREALARGVPQLVVVPCGSDKPYPPSHAELFASVARAHGSGVVYAQPRGTRPHRAMFVSRNAVIVAAADATLVVQAGSPSGSETTGRLALRRGQRVAAILGTPGCDALVAAGARAIAGVEADLAAALAAFLADAPWRVAWPLHLQPLRDALARAGERGATLDALGGPAVARALFEAAAAGLVVERTLGRWVEVGPPGDVRGEPT